MNFRRNTITKYFLICIFLCGTFSIEITAQENSFKKAEKLYHANKYFEASIEYERVIFKNPEPELLKTARYKKSLCYRSLHRYEDAVNELNRISLFNVSDSLKTKILYEKAFNLFLNEKPKEAIWSINRIQTSTLSENTYSDILPLKILILNHNRDWKSARATFTDWINLMPLSASSKAKWEDSVKIVYSENNLPKNYSQEAARNWSRFIPGAGHVYTGHPWEGVGNFLLNAAALGVGIHQLWYGYYFTGYFAGLGIFYKSYFGGMERSANLAEIEKENEMTEFTKSCTRLISKILKEHSSTHIN